jgi:hypothetical protein
LGVQGLHLTLLEVGVHLELVDGRDDGGPLQQLPQVLDHEVADADGADLAVREQLLQGAVGLERAVKGDRQRLVQDQQVDPVDAELAGALLEAVQRLVVAVVADPDLGRLEDRRAADRRRVHCLTDLALVAIGRGGVDVAVAGVERRGDRSPRLIRRRLEHAEVECRYLDAVVFRVISFRVMGVPPLCV